MMKKHLLIALMVLFVIPTLSAQKYEWEKPPKSDEKIIDNVNDRISAGYIRYTSVGTFSDSHSNVSDNRKTKTKEELYQSLLNTARTRNQKYSSELELRNFKSTCREDPANLPPETYQTGSDRYYDISATVVVKNKITTVLSSSSNSPLSKALDKALKDIQGGSRIAIDQITRPYEIDRNEFKDRIVELLLDKGFKVVAKEYLEKLFEEQKEQQSGIYNDETVAQMGNFTGVGYYLNVRLTEETLRIQVINVSTGEYEGNATVNL